MTQRILITGGAGFIGSQLVRHLVHKYPLNKIINLDKLTYAGNLENLKSVEGSENYTFIKGDILDEDLLRTIWQEHQISGVIHLAAESHVDRSITDPTSFVKTNVLGTLSLLNVALEFWKGRNQDFRFYHISTDEVYGSLGASGYFTEETAYDPKSPYSASKAGSDHLVRAYHNTFGLPILISNCSNNYGPFQFPEKLIPLMINNIRLGRKLPVYGKGDNIRDWLFVQDHAEAIDLIYHKGQIGQTYNIGGLNEWTNIDLVHKLCDLMDKKLGRNAGESRELIEFITDRPGHDKRYAIDATKIKDELGWEPSRSFEEGLEKTVDWYMQNEEWLDHVTSGAYLNYYDKHYGPRE